ncbi:MAG: toll/interleukin-1 receptor domain-containing protein [Bryobacteraceae bacterium]
MQTLTPTLFPCYAPADRPAAGAIRGFLERGAQVRVFLEEGELREGESLADKAREGLVADLIVLLFSRASWPSRRPRAEWEDAFLNEPASAGVRVAFARLDDCAPPPVLNPRFELAGLPLAGLRSLKRWVRGGGRLLEMAVSSGGDLEVLGIALADRPGREWTSAAMAARFTHAFREDFDAVLHLRCGARSPAALAGSLGRQLGLRLEGDLESNCRKLAAFCSGRRFLVVVEDAGAVPEELLFAGNCSTLLCPDSLPTDDPPDPLDQVQLAFAAAPWTEQCSLARTGCRLARGEGRLAEGYELMRQWHAAAQTRADRIALDESAREMVWILEAWGRDDEARALDYRRIAEYSGQLLLPF